MNSTFMSRQAAALAKRVGKLPVEQQITSLYSMMFARSPTEKERELATKFLAATSNEQRRSNDSGFRGFRGRGPESGPFGGRGRGRFSRGSASDEPETETKDLPSSLSQLAVYCQALLCTTEFQTID